MLYHVTDERFCLGEIKPHGNWGRMIGSNLRYGDDVPRDTAIIVAAETALETARLCLVPEAPSRLNCVYAWESFVDAARFQLTDRPNSLIYTIEPISKGVPTRRCDVSILHRCRVYDSVIENVPPEVMRYWVDEPAGLVEVLIGGPVRILSKL